MSADATRGQFFWRDLMTTDPERAEAFYTELFGWTIDPQPMENGVVYRMINNAGVPMGGIMGMSAEDGPPNHWITYIETPDVDATCARATELGASVHVPPTDIPETGRFAVVGDPQGAFFSPMTSSVPTTDPTADVPLGGAVWNELETDGTDAAVAFYTDLFGYESEGVEMDGFGTYTLLRLGAHETKPMVAGIGPKMSDAPGAAWGIYFRVGSMEEARAKIEDLGGQNVTDIMSVSGTGRMSGAIDPTGAFFSILEPEAM